MAQFNFTLDEAMVKEVLLGEDRSGVLASLLEAVVNQLLQHRADELCGAETYRRSEDREDYRNGNRPRELTTRLGTIHLLVPRLRNKPFTTELFERYKRSEQALIAGVAEMVVKGVSTRKVADVAEELFGREIPKSTVSRMCEGLDPIVNEFRERPLAPHIPFVIVDAMYIKLREGGRVVSKALYIATGTNEDGFREVLGFTLADAESKALYKEFFRGLRERGLERVGLVVSDSHTGLREAIRESFPGASWQRCQTHFSRNMLDATPKKLWPEMKEALREIYTAPDVQTARARKDAAVLAYGKLAPKAAALLDDSFDDIAAVFALPATYRKRLRTSNGIERLNEEVRRRERPIRIFPSEGSVMRILGTVLMEAHEKWVSGKRYLNMDEYFRQSEETPAAGDCQKEVA